MWWCTKCPDLWPNENEARDAVRIPFIEHLGGAHMHGNRRRLPFALCMQKVEKHSTSNQAHMDLMTIARLPGRGKQWAPINHDIC